MKKTQKADSILAQSVYSFYCPCTGSCSSSCDCKLALSLQVTYSSYDLYVNNPQETVHI